MGDGCGLAAGLKPDLQTRSAVSKVPRPTAPGRAHAQVHYVSASWTREVGLVRGDWASVFIVTVSRLRLYRTWWGIVIPLSSSFCPQRHLGTLAFMEVTGKGHRRHDRRAAHHHLCGGHERRGAHSSPATSMNCAAASPLSPPCARPFREVGLATFLTSLTTAIGISDLAHCRRHPCPSANSGSTPQRGSSSLLHLGVLRCCPLVLIRSKAAHQRAHALPTVWTTSSVRSAWEQPWLARRFVQRPPVPQAHSHRHRIFRAVATIASVGHCIIGHQGGQQTSFRKTCARTTLCGKSLHFF